MSASAPKDNTQNHISPVTFNAGVLAPSPDLPVDLEAFKAQDNFDADRFADLRVLLSFSSYGNSIAPTLLLSVWMENIPEQTAPQVRRDLGIFLSSINWNYTVAPLLTDVQKLHKAAEIFSVNQDMEALVHDAIDEMKNDFIGADIQRAINLASYANMQAAAKYQTPQMQQGGYNHNQQICM